MKNRILSYGAITAGTVTAVCALNLFLTPARIAPGGVSGLATIFYYAFGLPIGVTILAVNLPLFALGWRMMGRAFAIRSLYATLVFSLAAEIIPVAEVTDPFLSAVYGGVLMGAGLGVVMRFGASTGGTEMAATVLNRKFAFIGVSTFVFAVDFVIIVASGVVFGVNSALYAIASVFLTSKLIDYILEGLSVATAYYIITGKGQEICAAITGELNRSATVIRGKGAYRGTEVEVILCVLGRPAELVALKNRVRDIDPAAFMISCRTHEVLGEGFKKL